MKKRLIAGILIFLILAAAGAGIFYYHTKNQTEESGSGRPQLPPEMEGREGIVAATGTTSTGLIEKELDLDFLETDLIVDEIYVSSSDEVEAGTKVLKITDSSLREAARELERAQMDASLAYRQGVIDYETGRLEAENTLNKSMIESGFAQTVYDDTIAKAEAEVRKAERELEEAQEILTEYTAGLEEDYYYTEYEVEKKKAAYEKNMALFFEKLDDYGYELDDDDDDDPNTFLIVKEEEGGPGGGNGDDDGELTVLELLKSEYQENKEEYDQAVKDCEAAVEKARAGLGEAEDKVTAGQLALEEAQISLEKAKVSAQTEYNMSSIKGQKAQDTYETELKSLKETLDVLADDEEEAAENYELFMETIGDGCLYTESAGVIMMIRAAENTALPTDGILMAYSDAGRIQVTAAVDQSDIAKLEVGDCAAVVMEDFDTYTGTVTQINPVSASSGRASVSYSVVLELEEDVSQLSANLTASVYFGVTGQEYDAMTGQGESKGGRG